MQIIAAAQFDNYWKSQFGKSGSTNAIVDSAVREIIEAVRAEGDAAVRRYAERFDKSSPAEPEVPFALAEESWKEFCKNDPKTSAAMELAADHIRNFAELQRKHLFDFETEIKEGLFTGQRVIPVERAAVYVPAGRFPLFSSVLMGTIPAIAAGVSEILLVSPPMEDGIPSRNILAAAGLAGKSIGITCGTKLRIFAMGGAQAIAALALGTESVPRSDIIVGPGNKYVAAAKKILYGEVGIDLIAGPTDVLVIADNAASRFEQSGNYGKTEPAELIAADMLAQAEHDTDAKARALVPDYSTAEKIIAALEKRLAALPPESQVTAKTSLDTGGIIIVYQTTEDAVRIANIIAPEHLELHCEDPDAWISAGKSGGKNYLRNYGSLFIGSLAGEVLGDYSSGINHTLPTSGGARFTGGLSVRNFLKIPTTLRCIRSKGFEEARKAAEILGAAEGLYGHAQAALERQ